MPVRLLVAAPAYVVMYAVCLLTAYLLRFEFVLPEGIFERFASALPTILIIKIAACIGTREWSRRFRYTNMSDMIHSGVGVVAAAVTIMSLNEANYLGAYVPRSVILIDMILSLLATGLLRCGVRLAIEAVLRRRSGSKTKSINTLIYNVEDEGISILRAIQSTASEHRVVGFVDEKSARHRSMIGGVPVFAANRRLDCIARRVDADQVLLPGNMPGRRVREIIDTCKENNLTAHVIPAVDEIVDGRFRLAVRDVTISDLLRREPAQLDMDGIRSYVKGRRVLITGAAGSIGSELCRQVLSLNPAELIFVDQSEFGVFSMEQEIKRRHDMDTRRLKFCVRDVTDREAMSVLMDEHQPEIVFHAAAYKHVPLMEENPQEAIRNNVFGTQVMVDMADEKGIERFVLISTDKAVRPTSVMGRTKLLGEKYLQAVAAHSKTKFITVRFGNVLNSMGSVVPTFRRQIEEGGPITVTDPEMVRFFMTIPEAVQLVLQAGAIGNSGDILILDMGDPVKIVDLARDMINLSGLRFPDDIDIVFTGMRPGEKLYEELFYESEEGAKRVHEQIFCAPRSSVSSQEIDMLFRRLQRACSENREEAASVLLSTVEHFLRTDELPVKDLKSAA